MRTEAESDEPRPAAPGLNFHPVERALVGIDDRVGSDEAIGGRQDEPVLGVGLGVTRPNETLHEVAASNCPFCFNKAVGQAQRNTGIIGPVPRFEAERQSSDHVSPRLIASPPFEFQPCADGIRSEAEQRAGSPLHLAQGHSKQLRSGWGERGTFALAQCASG